MRGACMGAPCPECGDPKYQHVPGEHGIEVREVNQLTSHKPRTKEQP